MGFTPPEALNRFEVAATPLEVTVFRVPPIPETVLRPPARPVDGWAFLEAPDFGAAFLDGVDLDGVDLDGVDFLDDAAFLEGVDFFGAVVFFPALTRFDGGFFAWTCLGGLRGGASAQTFSNGPAVNSIRTPSMGAHRRHRDLQRSHRGEVWQRFTSCIAAITS